MKARSGLLPAILAPLLWLSLAPGALAQLRAHRTLSVQDGLAHPQVLSIAEDAEGFLWFGTVDGASRFDGLEMVSFRQEDGLPGNEVYALFTGPGGVLYFGTYRGLAVYQDGRFTLPPAASGLLGTAVWAITGGPDGSVLFGTDRGVVARRPDGRYERFFREDETPATAVLALHRARDGTLYAGTWDGLFLYREGRLVHRLGLGQGLPGPTVRSLGEGPDGTIHVGTSEGLGLYREGAWLHPGRALGPRTGILALAVAPADGTVFFGTHLFGMFLGHPPGPWRSITTEHGLTWSRVAAVHRTRGGTLYIGTERGVGIYEPEARVETWNEDTGLHEDSIYSLVRDGAEGVYVGTGRGIARYAAGQWRRLPPVSDQRHLIYALHRGGSGRLYAGNGRQEIRVYEQDRLVRTFGPGDGLAGAVYALHEGPDTLYAGTEDGLYGLRQGRWTELRPGSVTALAAAPDGGLYVGTREGLVLYRDGAASRHWTQRDGLADNRVLSLRNGRGGSLYIATTRGLSILRDGRLRTLDRRAGLSHEHVSCVVEDEAGRLFASTRRGINVFDPAAASPGVEEVLTPADGLAATQSYLGACDRAGGGRLWFGFPSGASAIEPRAGSSRREPPRVRLAGLELAGRDVPLPPAGQALPLATRQSLTVSFLVVDLVAPRRVRYRHRLADGDRGWSETPLRSVHLSQLPPGEHTFEVQAAHESAVWGPPARLSLRVEAPFYERRWFLPLVAFVVSGSGAAALAYRARSLLALERLRTAIAADLHDQIGSGLTEIAILSEIGEPSRAAATARELAARMNDVVWLVNPRRDSLYQLFLRLKDSYAELFAQAGVLFRTVDLSAFEKVHLPMSYRQNLYSIFREALHNALRHGQCREIALDVAVEGKRLSVTLCDDGRGFDPARAGEQGDGLANMQRRAAAIGGRLAIDSSPGRGTTVRFTGPLHGRSGRHP